jgi:glycosyltransferase involved in cell wall biosynthesis
MHNGSENLIVRVLIITQYFYPEDFRVNELAFALQSSGHDVVVLTGQPNYPSGRFFPGYSPLHPLQERYNGIQVIRVPLYARHSGRPWELALNYISFALSATIFGLPRLRGRFDACLVYCPSPITTAIPAIIYRLFRGKPVAIWVQDLWPESVFAITPGGKRWLNGLLSRLVCWIYMHADQIWVQSLAYVRSVEAHGGSIQRIAYVPNWAENLYDCERWANVEAEPIPENSLVFAGNLGRAQGLDVLLDAAEFLVQTTPSVHWVFVGDGSARGWLEDEVRRRGLTNCVMLLPRRAPQDMPKILKAATGLLITLRDADVFAQTIPSKVQSCLAAGRPVIGVLAGEPARILEEARCGYVCPPHDPAALAAAIKKLVSLPQQQREELGRSGNGFYQAHFTQAHLQERIETLLVQLADPRNLSK